tara:strand:+ start:7640 stop:7825 length:186 start_codon:yes stop_codon:yes gene_type:complete
MALSLDAYVASVQKNIVLFAEQYRAQHKDNPDNYPLVLENDNAGLWNEFFIDHLLSTDDEE